MMSKWKTTQRRSKRLPNSEFGGNLSVHSYGEPASDSSSLSFLDDMLGQTAAPRPPMRRQEVRRDTDARTPPPPQMQVEDIDDILGLVSAPDEERRRDSSSSGFSSRGNRRTERREPEAPISPYEPRPTRSSIRPLSRYGSGGSGGSIGPGSRDHSADPPQFPTRSQRKIERSGKGQPSQETSLDYSPRPHSYVISLRSDGHRSSNADTDDYIDDDNLMPIPVFQVNNDDDDTISCITTSVSSHYDAESRSGSFPWSRRSQKTSSQGEHSYADTLDEIADMLHPNQNGRSNGLSPRVGGNSKTSAGSNEFFRPPPPVQLTSVNGVFGSNPLLVQSDAPTLNADEIYRGTKAPKRQSHNSWMSFEPFLSQTRLLFRYWISRILPRHWRWKGGKDDDGQGYLGTWNSGSDPKMLPSSMQPQARYKYVLVAITLIIVLGRLAILQSPKIKATTMRRIRAVVKKHATKRPIAGIDIHGGMTKRSDGSAVGGSVAGGMARHNVKELNSPPKKHDHSDVELPEAFNVLADVTDLPVRKGVDAPFYWHIPRASGGTVNDILVAACL
ncbi:hypothetical protein MHU86_6352 [Fragilaria crotonensis]|nr:hypothetical protein MHU86_6352 [Fragilaria crotonensis]